MFVYLNLEGVIVDITPGSDTDNDRTGAGDTAPTRFNYKGQLVVFAMSDKGNRAEIQILFPTD